MTIIERDEVLTRLGSLFAGCAQYRGGVALVTGPMGFGKTELLRVFGEEIRTDGSWLSAFATKAEHDVPMSVIDQLLHNATSVDRENGSTTAAPELTDLRARAVDYSDLRMMRDFSAALLAVSERTPVVITVDDAHHADTGSLRCLLYLANRLSSSRVLIVLSDKSMVGEDYRRFRADLTRLPYAWTFTLEALSASGTGDLVTKCLHPSPELTAEIYAATGGNPLLVHALIQEILGSSGDPADFTPDRLPAGKTFSQAISNCLHRCDPKIQQIAYCAAILGDEATPKLVSTLTDTDPVTTAEGMNALATAGLMRSGRAFHPMIRRAIIAGITVDLRSELYGRAAMLLYEEGASALTIAPHLLASGDVKAGWAPPVLKEAAEMALLNDGVDLALSCLNLALRICDDPTEIGELREIRARAQRRVDPTAPDRLLGPINSVIELDGFESRRPGTDVMDSLLPGGSEEEIVRMLEHLGFIRPPYRNSSLAKRIQNTRAVLLASSLKERQAATALIAVLNRDDDRAPAVVERFLNGSMPNERTVDGVVVLSLVTLLYADRLDTAERWCDIFLERTASRRGQAWEASLSTIRGEIALRRGDLPTAQKHVRSALNLVSSRNLGIGRAFPLSSLVRVATEMGRYDEAAILLDTPLPRATFDTRFGVHYRNARGHYYLATGRAKAALEEFLHCGQSLKEWRIDRASLVPWRSDAALAHLQLGNTGVARALVSEQLERTNGARSRTRGISLLVMAQASVLSERAVLLKEAIEILEECGDRLHLTHALRGMAQTSGLSGDTARARALSRRAEAVAEEYSIAPGTAPEFAGDIEDESEPDDGDTLSQAERRVAVLAGTGHSNKEIARKLYITTSTVEQHLTRVYRKLAVRRRTELAARLGFRQPGRSR